MVGPVDEQQVDAVRVHAAQTALGAAGDVAGSELRPLILFWSSNVKPTLVTRTTSCRRVAQRLGQNLLRVIGTIDLRRIEERDAVVDGALHGARRLLHVDVAVHGRAHLPGAKAQGRANEAGIADRDAVPFDFLLWDARCADRVPSWPLYYSEVRTVNRTGNVARFELMLCSRSPNRARCVFSLADRERTYGLQRCATYPLLIRPHVKWTAITPFSVRAVCPIASSMLVYVAVRVYRSAFDKPIYVICIRTYPRSLTPGTWPDNDATRHSVNTEQGEPDMTATAEAQRAADSLNYTLQATLKNAMRRSINRRTILRAGRSLSPSISGRM